MSAQLDSRQMLRLVDRVQWWRSARSPSPVNVEVDAAVVVQEHGAAEMVETSRGLYADVSAAGGSVACPCGGVAAGKEAGSASS